MPERKGRIAPQAKGPLPVDVAVRLTVSVFPLPSKKPEKGCSVVPIMVETEMLSVSLKCFPAGTWPFPTAVATLFQSASLPICHGFPAVPLPGSRAVNATLTVYSPLSSSWKLSSNRLTG